MFSQRVTTPTVLRVALPVPLPRLFDYLPPPGTQIPSAVGHRVRVPFGQRELTGVVVATGAAAADAPELRPATALLDERRRLERELAEAKKALALGGGNAAEAAGPEQISGNGFIGQVIEGLDPKGLRGLVDEAKQRLGSGVVALIGVVLIQRSEGGGLGIGGGSGFMSARGTDVVLTVVRGRVIYENGVHRTQDLKSLGARMDALAARVHSAAAAFTSVP